MRFLVAIGALLAADLLLAFLFPARHADAGSALRLELPELVQRSELIVEGRILATHTVEEDGLLLTEVLLEATRTLKGEDRTYRTLRLPGGLREDGSGMVVPGVPRLVPGEETLLFLGPEGRAGMRMPTGLAQGKFALRRVDGRKELLADTRLVGLLEGGGGKARDGETRVLDYADLIAAIEAANAGAGR